MAHELKMDEDGILRIKFIGDTGKDDAAAYLQDLQPFLETATAKTPLNMLIYVEQAERFSGAARKAFDQLNQDARTGKLAYLGANRFIRVLASFVSKASNRNNMRFFDTEAEALTWLKSTKEK